MCLADAAAVNSAALEKTRNSYTRLTVSRCLIQLHTATTNAPAP